MNEPLERQAVGPGRDRGSRRALRPESGMRRLRRNRPAHCRGQSIFLYCSYATPRRMNEKYDLPVSHKDLLFTVETALHMAGRLWPKRRRPRRSRPADTGCQSRGGPHRTLRDALLRQGAGAQPRHAGSLGRSSEEGSGRRRGAERVRYSGSVGAIPPMSSAARRRVSTARPSVSSRSTARRAACSGSGSGGAFRGSYMRGMTVARA